MNTPLTPPVLKNDCFALPQRVKWTPVADALAHLRDNLSTVVTVETCDVTQGLGRVLAEDVRAVRDNPPLPNAAVDGYGFAGGKAQGAHQMPLFQGRAAAGPKLQETVPAGQAVRILTGAALPDGVDSVIMQEDVSTDGENIAFHGPIKAGANARKAGEDVRQGDLILPAGRRLRASDLAILAACGVSSLRVYAPLRVAVISTGDELVEAGKAAKEDQIYDANRPMLLALISALGHEPVDMGRCADDREALRQTLDQAAQKADVILSSGGASDGDEDHVSALLREAKAMQMWRIAIKPGRPLALGIWQGVPVFGLPGNPVAAMTCALIFARPALAQMAGADCPPVQGFEMPANFEKSKKAGRSEFLRARLLDGKVEVYPSEGSGRIYGLAWADGLVELPPEAMDIKQGDFVRYIPFTSFGL